MTAHALTTVPLLSSSFVQRHRARLHLTPAYAQRPIRHSAASHTSANGSRQLLHAKSAARPASAKLPQQHPFTLQAGLGFVGDARSPVTVAAAADASQGDTELVLVVGATGGVGQLVVASLLEKGKKVRAVVRDVEKAKGVFSGAPEGSLEIVTADLRFPEKLKPELVKDVGWVVLATGTTAFPSSRWKDNNGPEQTGNFPARGCLRSTA